MRIYANKQQTVFLINTTTRSYERVAVLVGKIYAKSGYLFFESFCRLRDNPLIRAIRRRIAHLLREGEGFRGAMRMCLLVGDPSTKLLRSFACGTAQNDRWRKLRKNIRDDKRQGRRKAALLLCLCNIAKSKRLFLDCAILTEVV